MLREIRAKRVEMILKMKGKRGIIMVRKLQNEMENERETII
jgi:hypothetical protein